MLWRAGNATSILPCASIPRPSIVFIRTERQTSGSCGLQFWALFQDRWVYEHYPGCGERGSCIDISLPGYHYVSGKYCPRGENVEVSGQGPVYFKQGLTKQETFWLQRYDTGRNAGCNGGDWAILKPDPTKERN